MTAPEGAGGTWRRWWLLTGIVVATLAVVGAILVVARPTTPSGPGSRAEDFERLARQPHLAFLSTTEAELGRIAVAPLRRPASARATADIVCQRQFSRGSLTSCLSTVYGITTAEHRVQVFHENLGQVATWELPGAPSRTAISPDGKLVATTAFVTGDDYLEEGFSTRTAIRSVPGDRVNTGSLERFSFTKDGKPYANKDINLWGVTFTPDSRGFYVSVSTGGVVYLAKGDLASESVELLRPNVECPSLSPDGTTIAYKYLLSPGRWRFHALDLATGADRELGETRSVDDQVQWLDDTHIMYGVPRTNAFPAVDVYSLPLDGGPPSLLLENGSSPSVVSAPG